MFYRKEMRQNRIPNCIFLGLFGKLGKTASNYVLQRYQYGGQHDVCENQIRVI